MTEDMPRLLLIIRGMLSISLGLTLIFSMTEFRFSKKRSVITIVLFFIFSICANVAMLQMVGYGNLSKLMTILFTTWIPAVVPKKISIDEMELCTALSNLLENATQHGGGIGLQSVAAIVKKHEGAMNVSHTEITFTVDIALKPITRNL